MVSIFLPLCALQWNSMLENPDFAKMSDEALVWVKANQKMIIERFAGAYVSAKDIPVSIFMGGSPGAGKTEFSKNLLDLLQKRERQIVRIDPDEIRECLPNYIRGKSHVFQPAVSIAVEKLHDHVLHTKKHFLLDGTSANFSKFRDNISRSLDKSRSVTVEYVYQEPIVAWDFTKKREAVEGRNIPKEAFIEQLFSSYRNISLVKEEFGERIVINVIRRNIQNGEYTLIADVLDVAEHVQIPYTESALFTILV